MVNEMNKKQKTVGVLAVMLVIAVVSAYTLPALATSIDPGTGTSATVGGQTCTQGRARLRNGSYDDGSGTRPCNGTQTQLRKGVSDSGLAGQGQGQHRYGNGSS